LATSLNVEIANAFESVAQVLEQQGANPFRVQAYREGASTLCRLTGPVRDIFIRDGLPGLERLPAIGPVLARGIRDVLLTGRLPMLDRLHGTSDPVSALASVPGIGETLAERLHHELGIGTLEELEAAAHDGRLEAVSGIGAKRLAGIRDTLATRLGRLRAPIDTQSASDPSVAELLAVDREYRTGAAADTLHRIAPRRFNPAKERWLPVLHKHAGGRHYTALFSNTARAHRLGRTHDWVVIYYDGSQREGQSTVITAQHGSLRGRRVVRGREAECSRLYRIPTPASA
jgi:putative hydrolase